jgi:phosphonate transport system permease protein
MDGVKACGGNGLQTVRFGILPQVLPVMLSNALYIFESNTRSATILGIVGAGGIGFYLADRIRTLLWEEASFIMILILISVYLIDWLSKQVRMRLIAGR